MDVVSRLCMAKNVLELVCLLGCMAFLLCLKSSSYKYIKEDFKNSHLSKKKNHCATGGEGDQQRPWLPLIFLFQSIRFTSTCNVQTFA